MADALDRVSVAAIGTSLADLEAETKQAEEAGVECVWAPELFRSAVTQAAYLAGRTSRVKLTTGAIILPWNDPLRLRPRLWAGSFDAEWGGAVEKPLRAAAAQLSSDLGYRG